MLPRYNIRYPLKHIPWSVPSVAADPRKLLPSNPVLLTPPVDLNMFTMSSTVRRVAVCYHTNSKKGVNEGYTIVFVMVDGIMGLYPVRLMKTPLSDRGWLLVSSFACAIYV